MAFVYRAERNLNNELNRNTGNNTFPGEYFNKSSFVKDIDRQSSEFQSNSKRELNLSKIDNIPGPGSYERNIIKYTYPHYHKKAKSKDIYEAVKINLIPKEILRFLEKKQNIAFNSRGQRFNYKIDLDQNNIGPGSYSPNGSSSLNAKTDYSTILLQNNSSKKSQQSHDLSSIFPNTFSDLRTETIPSKGILGYKINKNGVKKMIKSKINSENLIGPGTYDINLRKKENGINWSLTNDEKDPKYNMIQFRKNLQPLTELEQNYLDNIMNLKNNITSKTSKKFQKNEIFKYQMNRRNNMIRIIKNKLNTEKDLIFDADPGPGYYAPDEQEKFFKTQMDNNSSKKIKCFQSTSPRFNMKYSPLDEKIGPGYYFQKTKPNEVKKIKQKKGHLINVNKDLIENSAYKVNNIKEDFKIPGPGFYENFGGFFFNTKGSFSSNKNNFGNTSERFKEKDNFNNDDPPGPGYYDTYHKEREKYSKTTNSLPKFSYKNKNLFTNFKSDLINVDEMSKITKDKYEVPPIGSYNPYITTTIDYNNKSRINTFTDKKVVGFGSQEKKTRSFVPKENNKLIGPGIYFKSKEKKIKPNLVPFNQNMKRFDYGEKNKNPGPGSYESSYYEQWNKKSHNILFV